MIDMSKRLNHMRGDKRVEEGAEEHLHVDRWLKLHHETYERFRGTYEIASQLVIEARRYAWNHRKTIEDKSSKCVVRFDKQPFRFQTTREGTKFLA